MDEQVQWLKQLSEADGVSGFEGEVKELLKEKLAGCSEISYDKTGSVLFRAHGGQGGPKIMLAAHMDEIGFLVKHITKEGFLKFTNLGGWWDHVMLGQRVMVLSSKGARIPGVVGSKPPHILSPEERKKLVDRKDMYIDVGAADEKEAKEIFGIRPGDPVVPQGEFAIMANPDFLIGKAWDNRVGCAIMAEVLLQLSKEKHPNEVYGAGTVQEEVGLRGAQTSAAAIKPDLAFIIDTCVAGDTPGVTPEQASTKLGQGVAVTFYDASMIPHTPLRNWIIEMAEKEKIPFQLGFSEGGGTDAGKVHLYGDGVPSLVLSVPTRYIHSHHGIIHRKDYESAVQLLCAALRKLDQKQYEELLER